MTTRCGGGKVCLLDRKKKKKKSKALHVPPSAGPGSRNGVGLKNLGGFRNALLLADTAFISVTKVNECLFWRSLDV